MTKGRLEAFSDAVIAIAMTIMVLEIKVPHGADWEALRMLIPRFLTYMLSYVFLGIYWNNHHHMLHATERVNGTILWANLHLLFWLSLIPVATGWWEETNFAPLPTAAYAFVQVFAALAYTHLQSAIISHHGRDSKLGAAIGSNVKGKLSLTCYVAAVPLAFVHPMISTALLVFVASVWFIPDRRIESRLNH
jgi:TMEM175 potassium channel family protein